MREDSSPSAPAAFSIGQSLGPYTISGFLGAGGMAEVYAARDERLGRDVAIKAVATHRADPERIRRFKQEARATGQLSHPNIVAVYDVGEDGGVPYLVTELLDGQTLRSRLDEGHCSVDEALRLAKQLCKGLAAAHARGIIHRDLKPSNLFLLRDGHLKILDFGLAKLTHPEWEKLRTDEDTISVLSSPGAVFGSVGYMAPEQVEGGAVDHRTDIFAVGTILYELLTGVRTFHGPSPVETLHAILKESPEDLRSIRSDVPDQLAAIIHRCLSKKPQERFQTAEDLVFALDSLDMSIASKTPAARSTRARLLLSSFIVVTLAAIGLWLFSNKAESTMPQRYDPLPMRLTELTPSSDAWNVVLSPDRRFLAYAFWSGSSKGIRLRHLPSGTEIDLVPASKAVYRAVESFSQDSNFLYYSERISREWSYEARKIALLGGEPDVILRTSEPILGTQWFSSDETQLAFISQDHLSENRLAIIVGNADGSSLRELTSVPAEKALTELVWSPDGTFLVGSSFSSELQNLLRIDSITGEQTPLFPHPVEQLSIMRIAWLSDGTGFLTTLETTGDILRIDYPSGTVHPITGPAGYARSITLIDDTTGLVTGRSIQTNLWLVDANKGHMIERITSGHDTADGEKGLSWASDGTIYFSSRAPDGTMAIWAIRETGEQRRQVTRPPKGFQHSEVEASPDGTFIIYREAAAELSDWEPHGESRIVRADPDGRNPLVLTADQFAERAHITSDSAWVVYTARATNGEKRVWKVAADGTRRAAIDENIYCAVGDVSPQGLISCCGPEGSEEFVISVDGGERVWDGDVSTTFPILRWSSRGNGMLYLSHEHGAGQIWLQPLSDQPPRLLMTVPEIIMNLALAPDEDRMAISRTSQVKRFWLAENLPDVAP